MIKITPEAQRIKQRREAREALERIRTPNPHLFGDRFDPWVMSAYCEHADKCAALKQHG